MSEKLRVDVLARGERSWATNALEFDSPEEATTYARDLFSRWTMVDKLRIVPVSRPKREVYEPGSEDPNLCQAPVPLFRLGTVGATSGATAAIARRRLNLRFLLVRHVTGDWGDLDDADKAANDRAVSGGTRIVSAYGKEGDPDQLMVITEADRSSTTILRSGDY